MRTIALGIGGLATGAGALAVTLRRLRAHQAARRLPGTVIDSPPAEAVAYETRIRPIATVEAVRWLAATNQFLTHRLAQHPEHALPSVIAARVGQFGVELLLDEACAPVDGFVDAGADATAWRLHPDLDLDSIEVEAADAQPYSPALVPVGTTEAGDLHLDLEQLAVIALEGEPDAITGWLRTIAADIATVPWARHCEIVAIGVSDELAALDRVTVPDDPTAWAERFALEMGHLNVRLDATPYEHRVNQGEVFHPTIVLIGQGHDTIARQLAEVAALINTPVAVIAAAVLPVGARVHLTATAATLEPSGLDFVPALTSSDELGHLAALLGAAGDPESSAYEPTTVGMGGSGVDAEMSADDGPETADVNDGGSELPVAELIATITRKRPIEVQILTPRPRVRGLGKQPQAKAESLIAYLAYHRSISSQTLREAFWPTGTNRSTADNALSQIRQLLGTQRDGSHRLTAATNTGRYELSDDVGCDWTKAQALIAAAARRGSNDTIELLRAGLQLVEGRIAADTVGRSYTWLQDDYEVYGLMERVLVDAAHQLGELALEAGDHELARWAAMKGLAVVPGQESLYRIQMRAAAATGDTQGVIDAFRSATGAAHNIDPLSDVQPETDELRRRLVDRAT